MNSPPSECWRPPPKHVCFGRLTAPSSPRPMAVVVPGTGTKTTSCHDTPRRVATGCSVPAKRPAHRRPPATGATLGIRATAVYIALAIIDVVIAFIAASAAAHRSRPACVACGVAVPWEQAVVQLKSAAVPAAAAALAPRAVREPPAVLAPRVVQAPRVVEAYASPAKVRCTTSNPSGVRFWEAFPSKVAICWPRPI